VSSTRGVAEHQTRAVWDLLFGALRRKPERAVSPELEPKQDGRLNHPNPSLRVEPAGPLEAAVHPSAAGASAARASGRATAWGHHPRARPAKPSRDVGRLARRRRRLARRLAFVGPTLGCGCSCGVLLLEFLRRVEGADVTHGRVDVLLARLAVFLARKG